VRIPVKDCQCEDFPCCEHADNFPDDDEPEFCEVCGIQGHSSFKCDHEEGWGDDDDLDEEEEEDES